MRLYRYLISKFYRARYIMDYVKFVFYVTKKSSGKIFFVDLDNTLANTWPQRLNMETFNWGDLPLHSRVLDFVKDYSSQHKFEIVVLSARPLSARHETSNWLTKIADLKAVPFFLTPDAMSKRKYFMFARQLNKLGAIMDDCSHSHEFGSVQFYDLLIHEILSLNTHFFDYKFLSELQKP